LFESYKFLHLSSCRIPHLGSEIQFIEDMVDHLVLCGEAGHMLTTLCVSICGAHTNFIRHQDFRQYTPVGKITKKQSNGVRFC